jgi:hypothetical protein
MSICVYNPLYIVSLLFGTQHIASIFVAALRPLERAPLFFNAHLINHALYAFDRMGHFNRAIDLRLAIDKTT